MYNFVAFVGAVFASILVIFLINMFTPEWMSNSITGFNGNPADLSNFFSVHASIWIAFFTGMFLVFRNILNLRNQTRSAASGVLSDDPSIVYDRADRQKIYLQVSRLPEDAFVRQMVQRSLAQYQGSNSWVQANEVLQATSTELQQRIDLSYTVPRYLTWLIPTLGFIGTVLGISLALKQVGELTPKDFAEATFLPEIMTSMGLAFSTTLLALILSGVLILAVSLAQSAEDSFVTDLFSNCVDNLLNKLHEES